MSRTIQRTASVAALITLAWSCTPSTSTVDGGPKLTCGPGTIDSNGICEAPASVQCGAGTANVSGVCLPTDGDGGSSLQCGQGTVDVDGMCFPESTDGGAVECGPGTINVEGTCLPVSADGGPLVECGPGTMEVNDVCLPIATDAGPSSACTAGQKGCADMNDAWTCIGGQKYLEACAAGLTCQSGVCAGGADGGTDAGPTDAGTTEGIGSSCTTLDAGSCAAGLTCFGTPVATPGMCSEPCSVDANCATGAANGLPGICFEGICWESCSATASNPCGRTDFACLPWSSTENICFADCRQESASYCDSLFGYPFAQCSQIDGSCYDNASCATAACSTGQACDTVGSGANVSEVCVPSCAGGSSGSCTLNSDCPSGACSGGTCLACPFGLTCDTGGDIDGGSLDACAVKLLKNYAKCDVNAQCPQNTTNPALSDVCVAFAATPVSGPPTENLCLQECTMTSQCPSGQTCSFPLGSASACGKPCSTTAADAGCPSGTACATFQGITGAYCAPG